MKNHKENKLRCMISGKIIRQGEAISVHELNTYLAKNNEEKNKKIIVIRK